MPLVDHPTGDYRFLPGIAPYSCGVIAAPGFEIVHATVHSPAPYRYGFDLIERHLTSEGRPRAALCGIELRSPRPFSFEGFARFNETYARILEGWGLFVAGVNPVARTNVAPEVTSSILSPEVIVRNGETSDEAIAEKANFVMGLMGTRLRGLGADWSHVTAIDVYTIHPIDRLLPEIILGRVGSAAVHGVRWFFSRPPIEGIEFEMDVRGVRTEIRLE
jgi:hypothetical protein